MSQASAVVPSRYRNVDHERQSRAYILGQQWHSDTRYGGEEEFYLGFWWILIDINQFRSISRPRI